MENKYCRSGDGSLRKYIQSTMTESVFLRTLRQTHRRHSSHARKEFACLVTASTASVSISCYQCQHSCARDDEWKANWPTHVCTGRKGAKENFQTLRKILTLQSDGSERKSIFDQVHVCYHVWERGPNWIMLERTFCDAFGYKLAFALSALTLFIRKQHLGKI